MEKRPKIKVQIKKKPDPDRLARIQAWQHEYDLTLKNLQNLERSCNRHGNPHVYTTKENGQVVSRVTCVKCGLGCYWW